MWSIQRGREPPPDKDYGFLRYASSTLVNHLKVCSRQSETNRSHARHEAISPKKPVASGLTHQNVPPLWLPSNPGNQRSPSYSQMLPPISPAASTSALSALPSPYTNLIIPLSDSPMLSPAQSFSNHPTPRSRSQSILIDNVGVWIPEYQRKFEERIARLTVSAGLPLSWVDNPEWIDFINDFLPFARSPSRKVLTNRLIPAAAKNHQDMAKVAAKNRNITLQADGWTGINFHHLLAFMITFDKQVRFRSFKSNLQ